ncbi:hypothetical protein ES703_74508 [subsurface metagenome]
MKFAGIALVPDIAVEATDIRGRKIAESVVVQSFQRAVDGEVIDLLAPLRRTLDAAERAAHGVDLCAAIGETVLHQHVDGAAERIEAEGGIVGNHGDRADRRSRNQIPVDGVAERLVDADAVLVDGEPLRRAGNGRGDKAAKLHVRLKRITRGVADDDARHLLLQGVGDVQRVGALDLVGADRVDG